MTQADAAPTERGIALGWQPPGVVATRPQSASYDAATGAVFVSTELSGPRPAGGSLSLAIRNDAAAAEMMTSLSGGEDVVVAGHPASLLEGPLNYEAREINSVTVAWRRDGYTVSVVGLGFDRATVLRVASNLTLVPLSPSTPRTVKLTEGRSRIEVGVETQGNDTCLTGTYSGDDGGGGVRACPLAGSPPEDVAVRYRRGPFVAGVARAQVMHVRLTGPDQDDTTVDTFPTDDPEWRVFVTARRVIAAVPA